MFLLDSLLIGGIQYVLDKVATVAEQELNDPERQFRDPIPERNVS